MNSGQLRIWNETVPARLKLTVIKCLRRLAAGPTKRRPGFIPRSVHVGFMVDKPALGQAALPALPFSPVSIIPNTHLTDYDRRHIH